MASGNINLRDPALYRIRKVTHQNTGDAWCIYPMYDYAHCISDALERITHSICTLEFQDHRPLYDWIIAELADGGRLARPLPQQYEFARLNLTYTVMSKRKLLQLVQEGHVSGWDDPRMPTLVGLRRLGYTPEAIRSFCERIGVSKADSVIDVSVLEEAVREDLNERAPRAAAVLRPLRLVLENYPEDRVEEMAAPNHPQKPERGTRALPFCRELWIERDDFMENPPKGFFRLAPGAEVRLRYAYIVKCERVVKDAAGNVVELRCTYDPATRSGSPGADTRKVKGNIHWVSARHAVAARVRLYDRLFSVPNPDAAPGGFLSVLNPRSIEALDDARLEPALLGAEPESRYQFERNGYFVADAVDSRPGAPVFNRTATLKDSWARPDAK
jgi:glutaminyl-tRNA synthetase